MVKIRKTTHLISYLFNALQIQQTCSDHLKQGKDSEDDPSLWFLDKAILSDRFFFFLINLMFVCYAVQLFFLYFFAITTSPLSSFFSLLYILYIVYSTHLWRFQAGETIIYLAKRLWSYVRLCYVRLVKLDWVMVRLRLLG